MATVWVSRRLDETHAPDFFHGESLLAAMAEDQTPGCLLSSKKALQFKNYRGKC